MAVINCRERQAKANPAAKNYGTNLVGIAAEQADYFTPRTFLPSAIGSKTDVDALAAHKRLKTDGTANADWTGLQKNVVEFRAPYGLTPVKQFYPVERLKGNPTPDPSIPGMEMGAGQISFYLDPTGSGFWLKHLLQATTVQSRSFGKHPQTSGTPAPIEVSLAAGSSATSYGAAKTIGSKQPKDIIGEITGTAFDDKGTAATSDDVPGQPKPPDNMISGRLELSGGARKVRVRGCDHNGALLDEIVDVPSSGGKKTVHAYAGDVTFAVLGNTTFTLSVLVDLSGLFEHVLVPLSTVSEGISLEVQEGNPDSPITYNGTLVSRGILRLEPVARFQAMVIANEALPRKSLQVDSSGVRMDKGIDIEHFSRLDFHAVPNCMMSWQIPKEDNPNVPESFRGIFRVASMGLAIDNRLAPPVTSFAECFSYPKPVRKANRELQGQVVLDYSKETDFDRFVGGLTFKSIFSATSRLYGGEFRSIRIIFNQSQMIANPTRQVNGVGEMTQSIVTRTHIGSNAAGNDEVTIIIINNQETF